MLKLFREKNYVFTKKKKKQEKKTASYKEMTLELEQEKYWISKIAGLLKCNIVAKVMDWTGI